MPNVKSSSSGNTLTVQEENDLILNERPSIDPNILSTSRQHRQFVLAGTPIFKRA